MPTRADWEAAVPKCPQKVAASDAARKRIAAGTAATRCYLPMHWHHVSHVWACPVHGAVVNGHLAAAERAAAEEAA